MREDNLIPNGSIDPTSPSDPTSEVPEVTSPAHGNPAEPVVQPIEGTTEQGCAADQEEAVPAFRLHPHVKRIEPKDQKFEVGDGTALLLSTQNPRQPNRKQFQQPAKAQPGHQGAPNQKNQQNQPKRPQAQPPNSRFK